MRIRSFGLLQLGPLPLGAFAEPEGEELFKAPRRERQRMFAAGPATNLFAAFVLLLLLGGIAGQFASDDQSIHVTGIVKGEGADEAGMLPWDTIETIQGEDVVGLDGFRDIVEQYNAGDSVLIGVPIKMVRGKRSMQPFPTSTRTIRTSAFQKNNWNRFQLNKATHSWVLRGSLRIQQASIASQGHCLRMWNTLLCKGRSSLLCTL